MKPILTALAVAAVLGLTPLLPAQPAAQKITAVEGIAEYHLPNGVRFLLFPDASRPVVTVNLTVLVGSRHEGYGETGMAHLLEHMVFKGTPLFPDVPKSLRDHGARFNGSTWVDRTNYYETMPAGDENLEFGIQLEADRLVNSYVKREDLISEMTVVRNEFEMGENSPESILMQRVMAAAYEWHNYGKSTIGNRSDIERVPIENLQAFYRKYYQPDNVVLVVAGKFDEKKALEYIQKYFGALKKPTRKLDQTYTEEPTQDGERGVTLRRVGSVGGAIAAFHIPAGAHPDFPAVEVLAQILADEPSGRLYKALVEPKKATGVLGVAFSWHDPGLMLMGATCAPDRVDVLRDSLVAALDSLAQEKVTAVEVERARTRLLKQRQDLIADSTQVAIQLSEWASKGDWRLFFLHRDRLEKVTVNDVNLASEKYLKPSNRTVGVFVPTAKPSRSAIPETPSIAKALEGYKGRAALAGGEAFEPTPANLDARLKRSEIGAIKVGMLMKKTRGETVNLQIALRIGNEESMKGQRTALELMADMLERGTRKHSRQEIQDKLAKLSSSIGFTTEVGLLMVNVQAKRAGLAETIDLLTEILRQPTFPEQELDLLKAEQCDALHKQQTDPFRLGLREMQRKLNPKPRDNPLYLPTLDEEIEQVKATTLAQVKELYEKQVSAQAGEVAVIGDFDAETTLKQLGVLFKDWTCEVKHRRIPRPAQPDVKGERIVLNTPDKANAIYGAGMTFEVGDAHPDFVALDVGNFMYGGGSLSSRLGNRVRQKEGLSYGVQSVFNASPRDPAARFVTFAITNPKNIDKLDTAVADELTKYLDNGPSLQEMSDAQRAYLESKKVGRTRDSELALQMINALSLNRPFAFYAEQEKKALEIGPEDVKNAFRKHIDPKRLVIIRAGDFEKK